MVFSSPIFLLLFLPLLLLLQLALIRAGIGIKNISLLAASLFFYSFGEPLYIFLMCASICLNHCIGRWIDTCHHRQSSLNAPVTAGITANLLTLFIFKYTNFLIENVNVVLEQIGMTPWSHVSLVLPLGISFYTFQSISYLVDVARKKAPSQQSIFNTALYISFFPQLIAGPIVRYHEIATQLTKRTVTFERFDYGIQRFVIGLGKKVLIANTLAIYVDYAFALPSHHLTPEIAWFAMIGYTLQIYFDFSGYSDMAIGLGALFGFTFPENFHYPYTARSMKEFWRKWHMTLSHWFRDYLFIPLGGSHQGTLITYRNLIITFFLCGLWHGAAWNFVAWGMLHGIFLILERGSYGFWISRMPALFQHGYTMMIVALTWIPFRANGLEQTLDFYAKILGRGNATPDRYYAIIYNHEFICILIIGALLSLPITQLFSNSKNEKPVRQFATHIGLTVGLFSILILSLSKLASGTYNPFIYFRF